MEKTKSSVVDMTKGNSVKLLLAFTGPMLIGNLFQQLYNVVDSVIVGKMIGANALAAVGSTSSAVFLFFALCNGIGNGGGIIVSQLFGGGEIDRLRKCMMNTAYIMLILPVIFGAIAYAVTRPLLIFMQTPADIMEDAVIYMHVMCWGVLFVAMYNYISAMLRALGDSKTPLYFLIVSCIINTVLDILFVKLGMGVFGAALATVLAQLLAGVGCIIYSIRTNSYFRFLQKDFAVDFDLVKSIMKLGVPLSLQFSLISISCMALQRVVNTFGPVAMAAFTATSRIESVLHQPYQTLGIALSTFTGQNYGAKQLERVREGYHRGLIMMLIFTLAMIPILRFFGDAIMGLFVKERPVIEMGAAGLKITSLFYIFLGVIYVIRGVLNGLGDGFFALLNGIVEVVGRFFVPVLLTGIAFIGVWGIWWATGIVWFLSAAAAWLRYIWYRKKRLQPEIVG